MVQDGNVATVTLNRPEKLNALNKNMWTRVGEVFRALNDDEGVRCVVLRGAGDRALGPGADISEFQNERNNSRQAATYGRLMHAAMHAVRDCRHPVVARIRGLCIGGALELALMCSNAFEAIMPRQTPTGSCSDFTGCKIQFVVKNHDARRRYFEKTSSRTNRYARVIHKGPGFQEKNLVAANRPFRQIAVELQTKGRETEPAVYFIHHHESDIGPVTSIFRSGISKSGQQVHGRPPINRISVDI